MDEKLRIEERFAVEVLRRHLGACFTAFDDNSAYGMVDGLFELPDGVLGALEVTTLASQDARVWIGLGQVPRPGSVDPERQPRHLHQG